MKFDWPIEQCRRCGLVFANPRAPQADILRRYDAEYFWNEYLPAAGAPGGKVEMRFLDERYADILSVIRRHAPQGRRLFEIGSGAGLFLKAAERAGWDVSGVELSEAGAGFAREHLGLQVTTGRVEEVAVPDGSVDVVTMFDVIEHLFDPRAILVQARRLVAPGGAIVITTPNYDSLSRYALGIDWAMLAPTEHMYYFTERTLAELLKVSGWTNVASEHHLDSWLLLETMNPANTHAPQGLRSRAYKWLVERYGERLAPKVRARGMADILLCVGS